MEGATSGLSSPLSAGKRRHVAAEVSAAVRLEETLAGAGGAEGVPSAGRGVEAGGDQQHLLATAGRAASADSLPSTITTGTLGRPVDVVAAAASGDSLGFVRSASGGDGLLGALPDIGVITGAPGPSPAAHVQFSSGQVGEKDVRRVDTGAVGSAAAPLSGHAGEGPIGNARPDLNRSASAGSGLLPHQASAVLRSASIPASCSSALATPASPMSRGLFSLQRSLLLNTSGTAKTSGSTIANTGIGASRSQGPFLPYAFATATQPTTMDALSQNSIVVTDGTHFGEAFKALEELYRSQELCDVVLQVDGHHIVAHRLVLAAASPYFRAMFTTQMRESRQDVITLSGMNAGCVQSLVDYAYSGRITVGENNVQLLLPAANLLQMTAVVRGCCRFLQQQLDCSNCLGIAQFADMHSCMELKAEAERFAREHYSLIVSQSTDEFLSLACDQYCELLRGHELNVLSEESLLVDVFRWLRHAPEQRMPHLHKVLSNIRLVLLPPAALVKLGREPEVSSCPDCRQLVDEAKNYLLLPEERGRINPEMTQPRKPLQNAVLYAVGGWCTGEALSDVERYDRATDEWVCVASMSKKRCGVGLAAVGAYLYALGGHDGIHYLNSIERYDPRSNTWSPCPVSPRCEVRTSVGIGVIGDNIYAVGGQDGIACLDMTECYNTKTGQWTRKTPMSARRLGVAVVVLNGLLYAIGGADGGVVPLCTAERYDPNMDRWEPIAPMLTKRKHHGAAPLHNHIYVAGGRDEHSELNSVECYSPITNTWRPVAHMKSYRSGVGLSVLHNRIFAVGGFNGNTYLRSVEFYNEEADAWTEVAAMNNRRLGGGVAIIQAAFSLPAPSPQFKPMPGFS